MQATGAVIGGEGSQRRHHFPGGISAVTATGIAFPAHAGGDRPESVELARPAALLSSQRQAELIRRTANFCKPEEGFLMKTDRLTGWKLSSKTPDSSQLEHRAPRCSVAWKRSQARGLVRPGARVVEMTGYNRREFWLWPQSACFEHATGTSSCPGRRPIWLHTAGDPNVNTPTSTVWPAKASLNHPTAPARPARRRAARF